MRRGWTLAFLLLAAAFWAAWPAGGAAAEVSRGTPSGSNPPQPQIVEAARAPQAAGIMRQVALTYAPQMSVNDRERDLLQKAALARRLLDVNRLLTRNAMSKWFGSSGHRTARGAGRGPRQELHPGFLQPFYGGPPLSRAVIRTSPRRYL